MPILEYNRIWTQFSSKTTLITKLLLLMMLQQMAVTIFIVDILNFIKLTRKIMFTLKTQKD